MKTKFINLATLFALCVGVISCNDEETPSNPYANDNDYNLAYELVKYKVDVVERTETIDGKEVTVLDTINIVDNVDLGLSVNWATKNLGAATSEDAGNYYAWGEIEPKATYTSENYIHNGANLGANIGGTEYDAATKSLGEGWRMPTKEEVQELLDKCIWVWKERIVIEKDTIQVEEKDTIVDVRVKYTHCEVVGPNGKAIYLPAVGSESNVTTNRLPAVFGCYWTASSFEGLDAWTMQFSKDTHIIKSEGYRRFVGQSIRPVKDK